MDRYSWCQPNSQSRPPSDNLRQIFYLEINDVEDVSNFKVIIKFF